MKIEINPGDRQLAFIILFAAIVVAISAVTAYNPAGIGGVPATMGHSVDEMEWTQKIQGTVSATGDFCTDIGPTCLSTAGGSFTCPAGFTLIENAGHTLGCMQTNDVDGVATSWWSADDYCFDNYGGRLPSPGEWYITMRNYALNEETDDEEWVDNYTSGSQATVMGDGGITTVEVRALGSNIPDFRCWIPAS